MPDGISQEQFDKMRQELDKLKEELDKQKDELKNQNDNRTLKQQVAKKLGATAEISTLVEMNDLPSPEQLREFNEMLQDNIDWFNDLLEAVLGILKTIIGAIISALEKIWEFIKSCFPDEETETAMVGDRNPEAGEYVSFATVDGLGENRGRIRLPAGFAGLKDAMVINFAPETVRMDVLFGGRAAANARCIHIGSFASVSQPIEIGNKKIGPMLQTLDPRMQSGGVYNPQTGEVSGRLFTRAFDGHLYTPSSPVVIASSFEGRVNRGRQPILEVTTKAQDFLSDAPLRRYLC